MNKLKMVAAGVTTLSPLMAGRTKLSTEDIIKNNNGVITIAKTDLVDDGKSHYPVFLIGENENAFYCGGIVLRRIVEAWIEYCGSLEKVNEMLASEPVQVKLEEGRTKDGKNSITKVTIL